MRQRAPDRRLACARRSGEQHAVLRLQLQLRRERIVFEGESDLCFQLANYAIDALPVHLLALIERYVAGELPRSQVFDEMCGVDAL
jgi:hypothetical protein